MISASYVFYGVNVIIGVASLIVIILAAKSQAQHAKKILIVALVLLILSAGILAFSLRIYKMGALAYIGQTVGGMDGVYEKVKKFRYYALAGTLFEFIAIVLLTVVTAKVLAPQPQEEQAVKEEPAVKEEQAGEEE
jgi:hypothetical protein